ncbi:hypothetical protein [Streptomyces fragilis]|uniref:Uncharacterized protein n=1 Tax=Streptomyces fragilis TaxID=67301 RepID=A0ABV2YCA1_9ACTN|nr:hypothetical protein [Streptomyces fragilis]
MPHPTSVEIAARIEELYGAPLSDLDAHARQRPPGMLSALLDGYHRLALAEQSILDNRHRLRRLIHDERPLGPPEVSHLLDAARRLAEAVAVRDAQSATSAAVLRSLGRADAPTPEAEPRAGTAPSTAPAPPLPPPSPATTADAAVPR